MRNFTKASLVQRGAMIFGVIVFALIIFSPPAGAAPEPQLRVYAVNVDEAEAEITIIGDFNDGGISFFLDGIPLSNCSTPPSPVTCDLPALNPGTYRLQIYAGNIETVQTTDGKVRPVQFYTVLDVTLGAVGPQGEQGEEGPPGQDGAPGLSGYEQIHDFQTLTVAPGAFDEIIVTCPAGKKVLGGSCGPDYTTLILYRSYPNSDVSWKCVWGNSDNYSTFSLGVDAYAICATVQ